MILLESSELFQTRVFMSIEATITNTTWLRVCSDDGLYSGIGSTPLPIRCEVSRRGWNAMRGIIVQGQRKESSEIWLDNISINTFRYPKCCQRDCWVTSGIVWTANKRQLNSVFEITHDSNQEYTVLYVLFQNIGNIWLAKIDSPEIRLWSNASFELQKQMYICTWKFVYLTKQCCLFEAFLPQMLDVILSISKCITMPFILKGVPHFLFLADLQTFNPLFISSFHPRGRIHTFKVASSLYSEIVGTLPLYMLWWKYYLHIRNNSNCNRIKKFRVWNPSKGRGYWELIPPPSASNTKSFGKRWQLLLSKTSLKICTFVYTHSKP